MSQLYDSNAYLREAESLLRFGTFDWSSTTKEFYWSEGLFRVLSFPAELRTPPTVDWFYEQIVEVDREHVLESVQKALEHKLPFQIQYRILDYTGNELVLMSRGNVLSIPETNDVRLVGITADLTAHYLFEQELKAKMEALDRSNFELEQFAYIASHDLQEPLRKITSFGERLTSRYQENLGEEGKHYLSRMLGATQRMKLLIESLLSYSRISRPEEPFTPVNLNEVARNVLSDFELRLTETEATVEVGTLPTISSLPTQMHQLFQNLLSNALKFTSSDRKPHLTITSSLLTRQEMAEHRLLPGTLYHKIALSDNGIGFEPGQSEQIFTLFKRLHGRSEYEGAGMGLAICKRIVENHGGIIYAQSKPGEGATFVLIFPEQQKVK
ncbi:hypothetical protein BWI93_20990 [Siphonobacter sp. BAB-5385]|uniref:sensor histidine kinase n=1 Tax=unclassified Siphonobacter TaxID=2635712 RepID=UPI000B9E8BF1|nr:MULTISPECIES: PAS domain-containing sensor histidine kinase [unclassified Siphonobacter]OZI06290.1 hypothetical protein BWI93_20990 [Siphonobacter sp. BAB-5385]PMD96052.1 hypothetical protein BWI97_12145 [Siphonobacter sp. BAB-5405]